MVAENLGYQSLDEIVFESRNKYYGAYRLRKQYQRNVAGGLLMTTAIFLLLVSLPTLARWMGLEGVKIPKVISKPTGCLFVQPIKPITIEANKIKPPASPKQVKPIEQNFLAQPTTAEVEEIPADNLPTLPSDNSSDSSPSGSEVFPTDFPTNGANLTEEKPGKKEPYLIVEQMPEFPGGAAKMLQYLGKNIRYPFIAQQTGTEGKVFVQFVIDADGKVSDVVIIKGLSKECDEEAVRVVKSMPAWKPGKQNGMAVPVKFVFPIMFRMNSTY
jgi:protein TonB